MKCRAEINEIVAKRKILRINETKIWFFERINKIHKPLAKLTKRKKKTKIYRIRDKRGGIKTDTTEIQRIH
jgi:hypothetical protein